MHVFVWMVLFAVVSTLAQRMFRFVTGGGLVGKRRDLSPTLISETILVPIRNTRGAEEDASMISFLLRRATLPQRVIVAARLGESEERRRRLRDACEPYSHNIRFVPDETAKVAGFLEAEKYVLLLSSSTVAREGWDSLLVSQLQKAEDESAILTCVPSSSPTFLCAEKVWKGGFRIGFRKLEKPEVLEDMTPVLSLFWSCSLSFSLSSCVRECVPQAANMDASFSVSLWTRGNNFRAPAVWVAGGGIPTKGRQKVEGGEKRSATSFYSFAGIDPKTGFSSLRAFCGLSKGSEEAEQISKFGSIEAAKAAMRQVGKLKGVGGVTTTQI